MNHKVMQARRHELLEEVAEVSADTAIGLNCPPDVAEQIGAAVADRLAEHFGGQEIYIGKDASYKLAQRDRALWDAYISGTKTNRQLMLQFDVSERHFRRLIKRISLRLGGDPRQMSLIPED